MILFDRNSGASALTVLPAENPRVSGSILLRLMDNDPEVVAEFAADNPDEYNATLVRALRALADEIETGTP